MAKFKDIPLATRSGTWECSYEFHRVLRNIDDWVKDFDLDLNPDFQRSHVWKPDKSSKYIEAILSGKAKNARTLYFNAPWWNSMSEDEYEYKEFVCVDGLQRITAIRLFLNNKIKAFGHYYNEFEDRPRLESSILINVNDLKTRKEVLQWYLDLNTGGIVHTESELQKVRDLIEEEAKND